MSKKKEPTKGPTGGVTRRGFLGSVGAGAVAAATGVARPAGVVARRHDAAAAERVFVNLEARDVVALPAVQRKRNLGEPGERGFAVNAESFVSFFRARKTLADRGFVGAGKHGGLLRRRRRMFGGQPRDRASS